MRVVRFGILPAALLLAFAPALAADNAAIKEKASVCSGCHGENGISQTENIPSLAGQPDQFIQWQLVFFRAGSRKNDQMKPIAEEITNEDIRSFGAYFSQMTPPKGPEDGDPDLSKKGAQVAAGRRCASCHTDSFAGTKESRGSRVNARNTWSRRCTITKRASASAAASPQWRMSPIT